MGSVSLTMDLSSDLNLMNYMAVTAHWMEAVGTDAMVGQLFDCGLILLGTTVFLVVMMAST